MPPQLGQQDLLNLIGDIAARREPPAVDEAMQHYCQALAVANERDLRRGNAVTTETLACRSGEYPHQDRQDLDELAPQTPGPPPHELGR